MKWPLVAYRIGLVIFLVAILLIAAMAVVPVLEGDVSVERDQEGIDWSLENETFIGEASVWINNSGYLDFEKIVFDLHVEALEDFQVETTHKVGKISAGEDRKIDLTFSKKISEIPDDVRTHLLRHDTEVNMSVDMSGQYSYALFTFTAERDDVFHWGAPFYDLTISDLSYSDGEGMVDVSFENHYRGELDFTITVELFNSQGGNVGSTTESYTVPSGSSFDETVSVELTEEPEYAVVTFEEEKSGMEFQEEVYR